MVVYKATKVKFHFSHSRFYYTLDDLTDLVIYMEMKLATKNSLNTYSVKRMIRFVATKYIFLYEFIA